MQVNDDDSCQLEIVHPPSNPNLPILWAFLILFITEIIWLIIKMIYKNPRYRQYFIQKFVRAQSEQNDSILDATEYDQHNENIVENVPRRKTKRVKCLDAFRGLAIVIMIFVNYGGGGYSFFAQ